MKLSHTLVSIFIRLIKEDRRGLGTGTVLDRCKAANTLHTVDMHTAGQLNTRMLQRMSRV